MSGQRCARCNDLPMLGDVFCVDCRYEQNEDDARFDAMSTTDRRTQVLLSAVDNALRNGSYMTGANLAFEYLCDELGVDRDQLPLFDPLWRQRVSASDPAPDPDAPSTLRRTT